MSRLTSTALVATIGVLSVTSASAATFTDLASFAGATTDLTTETFDANIANPSIIFTPNDPSIVFAGGIVSTATNAQQNNRVSNGSFSGGTRRGITDDFDNTITFDFGTAVTAFGGVFTNASPILVSGFFDGAETQLSLGSDGFFGLTSTTAFSTISFSTNTGGFLPFGTPTVALQAINFGLDDFSIGTAVAAPPVAPVPLPASAVLLLGALGGLGAMRKRRRPV